MARKATGRPGRPRANKVLLRRWMGRRRQRHHAPRRGTRRLKPGRHVRPISGRTPVERTKSKGQERKNVQLQVDRDHRQEQRNRGRRRLGHLHDLEEIHPPRSQGPCPGPRPARPAQRRQARGRRGRLPHVGPLLRTVQHAMLAVGARLRAQHLRQPDHAPCRRGLARSGCA